MKKLLLFIAVFLCLGVSSYAQNTVQFNIHHQLGNADFAMQTVGTNNLNQEFKVTRLQYYISEISITHDGGTETIIDDTWILVDAANETTMNLGNYDITTVEKITFHIGVDEEHNHLDPGSYASTHPLAPQFPSMHWGWNPGYRFIAYEGFGGSNFNQEFQLHGLGDANYFRVQIDLDNTAENNIISIDIDADYSRGLENIDVDAGVVVHGDYAEARECLENFRDYVFTQSSTNVNTVDISEVNKFDIYPNPTNENATILLEASKDLGYAISVTDITGKQVYFYNDVNNNAVIHLQLENAGFYFVNLIKEGKTVITKKLVSK